MAIIQVHGKKFKPYISKEEIDFQIESIASALNKDYSGRRPLFIAVLNGAFMFASDLFKKLTIEAEISFIKLASYRGTRSGGHVITAIGLDVDLNGKDVVVVEDIVDTGKTMWEFLPQLENQQPASLKVAALLYKPDVAVYPVVVDYHGFVIPDRFVVGYGLDYDGLGRNLDAIYVEAE